MERGHMMELRRERLQRQTEQQQQPEQKHRGPRAVSTVRLGSLPVGGARVARLGAGKEVTLGRKARAGL